jgi:hypothetical protein
MKKLFGLLVGLFLIGCSVEPPYTDRHTDKIQLRQLANKDMTETHTSRSFFLVAGSMSSNSETKTVVKLIGEVDGEYRFMQFDFEKVRIKIDNEIKTPYIVLNYFANKDLSVDRLMDYDNFKVKTVTMVCPEQYLPEKLLPIQL